MLYVYIKNLILNVYAPYDTFETFQYALYS